MNPEKIKLAAIKDAIDLRLRQLYETNGGKICEETKSLEYLMCLIEADATSPDFASSCVIKMYE